MKIEHAAGTFLIFLPLAFNLFYSLLARISTTPIFCAGQPPTSLSRFQAGGLRLNELLEIDATRRRFGREG